MYSKNKNTNALHSTPLAFRSMCGLRLSDDGDAFVHACAQRCNCDNCSVLDRVASRAAVLVWGLIVATVTAATTPSPSVSPRARKAVVVAVPAPLFAWLDVAAPPAATCTTSSNADLAGRGG